MASQADRDKQTALADQRAASQQAKAEQNARHRPRGTSARERQFDARKQRQEHARQREARQRREVQARVDAERARSESMAAAVSTKVAQRMEDRNARYFESSRRALESRRASGRDQPGESAKTAHGRAELQRQGLPPGYQMVYGRLVRV